MECCLKVLTYTFIKHLFFEVQLSHSARDRMYHEGFIFWGIPTPFACRSAEEVQWKMRFIDIPKSLTNDISVYMTYTGLPETQLWHWIPFGLKYTWWRHQMETFSALLAICAGNSPVPGEFSDKGQWRGALMFSLICVWINGWVNSREAGDLGRYLAPYDVTVMRFNVDSVINLAVCHHQRRLESLLVYGPLRLRVVVKWSR